MNDAARILVVEDDREIGSLVCGLLEREGFLPRHVTSGTELDAELARAPASLVLLDVMLPGEDGLSICRRLRARGPVPILMVTAKGDDVDRIVGLELGADDYLPKPFNPRELVARVRALLRRSTLTAATSQSDRLSFGPFAIDLGARKLLRGSQEVEISAGDYELLLAFAHHPQRVLSRDQLLDWTKGRSWEAFDRSIDVALSRLRRKIEDDPDKPVLIKTVRNSGYMLAVPVTRS
jgi:two-component system OmpR family response regulator